MINIQKPIVTEKSIALAATGTYTFSVSDSATKPEIAKAVKKLYGVDPTLVRVMTVKGKTVRRKTGLGKERDWKKALVTIKAGQKIKDFEFEEDKTETKEKAK